MEVVADDSSHGVGRTASVEPACLASLSATPCDYLRLRVLRPAADAAAPAAAASSSTLVKISVASDGTAPQCPARIWLSGLVLAELDIGVGAVLHAELVPARAVLPWSALHVSPVPDPTPSGATEPRAVWPSPLALPTAAEVRLSLGVGSPSRYHPWRSDCRCRETLVRHTTRVAVASRLSREPLLAIAVGVGGEGAMGSAGGVGGMSAEGDTAGAASSHRARSLTTSSSTHAAIASGACGGSPSAAEWGTVGCHTPVLFVATPPHSPPHAPPPMPTVPHPRLPPHPTPPPPDPHTPLSPPGPHMLPGPPPPVTPPPLSPLPMDPLLLVLLGLLQRTPGGDSLSPDFLFGPTGGSDAESSAGRAVSPEPQRGGVGGGKGAGYDVGRAVGGAQGAAGGAAAGAAAGKPRAAEAEAAAASPARRPADTGRGHRQGDTAGGHRLADTVRGHPSAPFSGGGGLAAGLSPVLLTGARGVGKAEAVAGLCARYGVALLELSPHQMAREYGEAVEQAVGAAIEAAKR